MNFIVSAPGKIILVGEHAVVYGCKAIASSINLRCQAQITTKDVESDLLILRLNVVPFTFTMNRTEFLELKIHLKKCDKHISSTYQSILSDFLNDFKINKEEEDFIKPAIMVFLDIYYQLVSDFMPIDITINSEFSYGCGLGSSAAYSTVLSASLLLLSKRICLTDDNFSESHLKLISEYAFRGEQIVHGTPSGIDNSISTFGNGIVFQRIGESMIKDNINIPNLCVLLVDTNVKRCTKNVVKHVNKSMQEDKKLYHELFSTIHEISGEMELLLKMNAKETTEDLISQLNDLIDENQRILNKLGVSHTTIEEIVNILKLHGVSAKLTGAGWGGCVFGIVNEISNVKLKEARHYLKGRGYGTYLTNLSCSGVDIKF